MTTNKISKLRSVTTLHKITLCYVYTSLGGVVDVTYSLFTNNETRISILSEVLIYEIIDLFCDCQVPWLCQDLAGTSAVFTLLCIWDHTYPTHIRPSPSQTGRYSIYLP